MHTRGICVLCKENPSSERKKEEKTKTRFSQWINKSQFSPFWGLLHSRCLCDDCVKPGDVTFEHAFLMCVLTVCLCVCLSLLTGVS